LNSYFKYSWEYLYMFGVISIISYNLHCLNSLYLFLSSYCLCFCLPSIVGQFYAICHSNEHNTSIIRHFLRFPNVSY
jgi:hypothetical protein